MEFTISIPDGFDARPAAERLRHYAARFSPSTQGGRRLRALMEEAADELDLAEARAPGGKLAQARRVGD